VDWSLTANHPYCSFSKGERDICPPGKFTALPHRLYRNNGDGTFTDVSKAAGVRVEHPQKNYGRGLGVAAVDVNGDGKPDLYVANDESDNFLYLNRSLPGKVFLEEMGLLAGVARDNLGVSNGSMGAAAADYDGCGRPSLWVTNFEGQLHALYHNDCRDDSVGFHYATKAAGIAALGTGYVGWGTGFLDLDHDGREHLVIANGHTNRRPREQLPVLLRNLGGGRFRAITAQGGPYFREKHNGRGVALGDLDNDGRTDLVVGDLNGPVVLLRNEAVTANHWLGVQLAGKKHRDVAGTWAAAG
jgi:hypothetical protein